LYQQKSGSPAAPFEDFEIMFQEGNLPNNSKCIKCRKACWSAECLTGMRCQWCGMTVSPCSLYLRPVYTNNVFRLSDATAASDTAQK
jgi:hypothetical protein